MEMIKGQKIDRLRSHRTIASIVTPLGEGGIGKIIVSGPDALSIVNKLFEGKRIADLREAASQKLYYGHIHDRGQKIDEVILHIIKQKDSFTGEDLVEVNCHGGIRVVMRIYECLQSSGAEAVSWDSLLLQSFENDKMDFIQKEALQEIVQARTKLGVKVLLDQYAGALSSALRQGLEMIERIKQSLNGKSFYYKTYVGEREQLLDSPFTRDNENNTSHIPLPQEGEIGGMREMGEGIFPFENDVLVSTFSTLADHIGRLLETAPLGMALTTPRVLLILGKPNVGKSTIINAILGEERMLVHHEPGTTRDYVSEFISIDGIPFELIDTAGIRDTVDKLESLGMEMTLEQLQRADKVVVVFDNSRPFDQEDAGILNVLNSWLVTKNSGCLHQKANASMIVPVVNKCDLLAKLNREGIESEIKKPLCSISAQNRDGLEDLKRRLVEEIDTPYKPRRPILFNKRQYHLLTKANVLIEQVKADLATKNKIDRVLQLAEGLKDIFTVCLKGS